MKAAILTDLTKCVGCEACALACKEINDLPRNSANHMLTAYTWSSMEHRNGVNIRRQCMHCEAPACASACPVGALTKTPEGAVIYDGHKCIGCRYCMIACPFGIPKYQWDKPIPLIQKCIFCYEKALKAGEQPACTATCPTGATIFGERQDLIEEARQRIAVSPEKYQPHIFGRGGRDLGSLPLCGSLCRTGISRPSHRGILPRSDLEGAQKDSRHRDDRHGLSGRIVVDCEQENQAAGKA